MRRRRNSGTGYMSDRLHKVSQQLLASERMASRSSIVSLRGRGRGSPSRPETPTGLHSGAAAMTTVPSRPCRMCESDSRWFRRFVIPNSYFRRWCSWQPKISILSRPLTMQ
jgi:hypothetical protein